MRSIILLLLFCVSTFNASSLMYYRYVDVQLFTNELVAVVTLYNGGLDGTAGAGAYTNEWSGLFSPNLNRTWYDVPEQSPHYPHVDPTVISQSQAISNSAQSYFYTSDGIDRVRLLQAVRIGATSLIQLGWDAKYNGFFWQLGDHYPPKDAELRKFYDYDYARKKSSEGQSSAIIALTNAFLVTEETKFLQSAMETLKLLNDKFLDIHFPAAVLHDLNRDYSNGDQHIRSSQDILRKFEALLTLYVALKEIPTDDASELGQEDIIRQIQETGDFIVNNVIQYSSSQSDDAYVYRYYNEYWQYINGNETSEDTSYSSEIYPIYGLSFAYQLSRAVELGFDSSWLITTEKLLNYFLYSGVYNTKNGIIRYLSMAGNGAIIDDGMYSWMYAEACRTFLHFAVLRNCDNCYRFYNLTITNIVNKYVIDPDYNGWYEKLAPTTFLPLNTYKAHIEKTCPEIGLYSEAIRLSSLVPVQPTTSHFTRNWGIALSVLCATLFCAVGFRHFYKRRKQNGGDYQPSSAEPILSREDVQSSDIEGDICKIDFI